MVNASEGVMRRRQAHPAYIGYCPQGRGRPKRERFLAWFATQNQATLDKEPGVKHRPKVAQSGYTERGNPSRALSGNAGEGDQAVCRDGVGCPKKLMPGVMPRIR
jgi:hypothetical protein